MQCLACPFLAVTNARAGSRSVRLAAFAIISAVISRRMDVLRNDRRREVVDFGRSQVDSASFARTPKKVGASHNRTWAELMRRGLDIANKDGPSALSWLLLHTRQTLAGSSGFEIDRARGVDELKIAIGLQDHSSWWGRSRARFKQYSIRVWVSD